MRTLSGGQQRRLDVGLALVGDPELLFLDEPTTGFDPSARRQAWDVVHSLGALGKTVLLTTHYMDEAQALADRVMVIRNGSVVAEGTPDQIGGRATGAVTISFALPNGVTLPPELGINVDSDLDKVGSHMLIVRVDDPVPILHRLTTCSEYM